MWCFDSVPVDWGRDWGLMLLLVLLVTSQELKGRNYKIKTEMVGLVNSKDNSQLNFHSKKKKKIHNSPYAFSTRLLCIAIHLDFSTYTLGCDTSYNPAFFFAYLTSPPPSSFSFSPLVSPFNASPWLKMHQ